ncbi:MAG: hypothetical protein LBD57_04650 [Endomicrobium sp.]|jgi:hypothetical protein|uniref:hypothetical protein n=1 Tax=Candidatus Endomicrobiellum cubanum TaxID=3242325 RepID=UPI00282A1ACF|nr:hypothetical protein [Endomicrobium sp.]
MKFHKILLLLLFLLLTPNSFANDTTDALNITKYHQMGFKGQGVKYAVIDSGFDGWKTTFQRYGVKVTSAITVDYGGDIASLTTDTGVGTSHGTDMVLEFFKIAPEAEVYLVYFPYTASMDNLFNWLLANGIKIVSVSLDIHISPFSGQPLYWTKLNDCIAEGILVFGIMGNHQKDSQYARLQKSPSSNQMIFPDGNPYIDVVADINHFNFTIYKQINYGNTYTFTAQNIRTDKKIQKNINDSSNAVGFDNDDNNGTQQNDTIRLSIEQISGGSQTLDVLISFKNYNGICLHLKDVVPDPTASISIPGCLSNIITCGAINRDDNQFGPGKANQISSVSGWGPVIGDILVSGIVIDGYMKPDFAVGVHGNATSPTAPTVAACFAVLGSQDPNRFNNLAAFKQEFFDNHVCPARIAVFGYTQGITEKTHGRGVVYMDYKEKDWSHPYPPPGPTFPFLVEYSNPTSLSTQGMLKFSISSSDTSVVNGHIFTISGELVKSFSTQDLNFAEGKAIIEWDLKNENGRKVAPGVYFLIIQTNLGKRIQKFAVTK